MTRVLNSPSDIETYKENQILFRKVGVITEAQWGVTADHDSEAVSFLETSQGVWDKLTSLRLGGTVEQEPPSSPSVKTSGISYDEFRALFTSAELTILDSCTDDAFMSAVNLTPLTVLQKGNMRFLISEAQATGAGRGINLASPKLTDAINALIGYGLLAANRKSEVLSGKIKS